MGRRSLAAPFFVLFCVYACVVLSGFEKDGLQEGYEFFHSIQWQDMGHKLIRSDNNQCPLSTVDPTQIEDIPPRVRAENFLVVLQPKAALGWTKHIWKVTHLQMPMRLLQDGAQIEDRVRVCPVGCETTQR